jgi:hypothetical protein
VSQPTQNYGCQARTSRGTVNYGLAGRLNAQVHIDRLNDQAHDGYMDMDDYNRVLPRTVHYREPGVS